MSFDKEYPNRKDHRKPYIRRGKYDATCRSHGTCSYCRDDRLHNQRVREAAAEDELRIILDELDEEYGETFRKLAE